MYTLPTAPRPIGGVLDDAIGLYRATFKRCWLLALISGVFSAAARAIRRCCRAPSEYVLLAPNLASFHTPETERARKDLGRAIAAAAAELSDDMRAAFLLADVHGFTMGEIGAALSIPEATAKTRVFRARQHMRERLADLRDGEREDGA